MTAATVANDFLYALSIIIRSQSPRQMSLLLSAMSICAHALYELSDADRAHARALIRNSLKEYEGLTVVNGTIKRQTTADYVDEFLVTQLIGFDRVATLAPRYQPEEGSTRTAVC